MCTSLSKVGKGFLCTIGLLLCHPWYLVENYIENLKCPRTESDNRLHVETFIHQENKLPTEVVLWSSKCPMDLARRYATQENESNYVLTKWMIKMNIIMCIVQTYCNHFNIELRSRILYQNKSCKNKCSWQAQVLTWSYYITSIHAGLLQLLHINCGGGAICVDRVEYVPSYRINMDPLPASQLVALESNVAFLQTKESVILPHANIVSRMKPGSSLANNDVSWFHFLSTKLLNTQILGVRITAIFCWSSSLFGGPTPKYQAHCSRWLCCASVHRNIWD